MFFEHHSFMLSKILYFFLNCDIAKQRSPKTKEKKLLKTNTLLFEQKHL